jgi:hypothetical protein
MGMFLSISALAVSNPLSSVALTPGLEKSGRPVSKYTLDMISHDAKQISISVSARELSTFSRTDFITAKKLARAQRKRLVNIKKSQIITIYVLGSQSMDTARLLRTYQNSQTTSTMSQHDYRNLSPVWSKCIVLYRYNSGQEQFLYPSRNPEGWWKDARELKVVRPVQ